MKNGSAAQTGFQNDTFEAALWLADTLSVATSLAESII